MGEGKDVRITEMSASLLDPIFILFLLSVALLRTVWPQKSYVLFGVLSSAALLCLAAPGTLFVITGVTLLYLYPISLLIRMADIWGWSAANKRLLLWSGVAGLVMVLVVFKLYRHFSLPFLGGPWLQAEIVALVGFSYFIFRAISFLHIQAVLSNAKADPLTLIYYMLFPPTITSGPIQRFQDFRQQTALPVPLTFQLLGSAGYRITRGFFRKLVVAGILDSGIKNLTDPSSAPTILTSLATIVLLYLYFYFDFAGYSDVAIGFGLLLGIRVPENFRRPFTATTIAEFWRNWHITLVDWFRDHVFIPLGGMHGSRAYAAILSLGIMILCGLWHGLTLSLLAWGLWHGVALFTEAISGTKPIPPALRKGVHYWLRVLWTNARVALPCVFFLPANSFGHVMHGFVTLPL